ncbi:MAG TPA: AsmA-like C-terminal domain-containing protein [Burkholderiaceae bacterium]|nr:AsmA-like C-terminal domain-containing protein [Burkholderiaceae bacterium]
MNPSGWPIRLGLVALAAVAIVVGAALIGEARFLDLPSVRTAVEHRLSQVAGADIAWSELRIGLLPVPRVEMRGLTIQVPGLAHASIEQAQARLRLLSLLRGRVEVTSLALVQPRLRIDLAPSQAAPGERPSDPLTAYRALAATLVRVARNAAPGMVIEVSQAQLLLQAANWPAVQVRELSLQAQIDPTGLELRATAAGNFWDEANLRGQLQFADLSTDLRVDVAGFNAQPWFDRLLAQSGLRVEVAPAQAHVHFQADAGSELRFDFGAQVASLQIARAAQPLQFSESSVTGAAIVGAQVTEVTLDALRLGSLLEQGRARLRLTNDAEKPELTLELPIIDVSALRAAVLALTAEDASARRHVKRALGGVIRGLTLRTRAESWGGMLDIARWEGEAALEHASVQLPFFEQAATDLDARVALSGANIELAGASAQLGASSLNDTKLRYSLRDGSFSANVGFGLDATQLLDFARERLAREQPAVLAELQSAAGRFHGHAVYASAHAQWDAGVEITQSDASVRLRSLPWPVLLRAARVHLLPGQLTVSAFRAAAGGSQFSDFDATLALGAHPRLMQATGRATLALEEIYPWTRAHLDHAGALDDVESVRGNVALTLERLSGPLEEPSALAFEATLLPQQLQIAHKRMPEALQIGGGSVHVDPNGIVLDQVRATFLDASAVVSGHVTGYRAANPQIQATIAQAEAGEQFTHWAWDFSGAPAYLEPRAPLRLERAQASWVPGHFVEAQFGLAFKQGPELTADLRWEPDTLDLRQLVLRDRANQAVFGLRTNHDLLELRFSGTILAQSIAAMFKRTGQYQGQADGDLRMTLDLQRRGRTVAQGFVKAQDLDLQELLPSQLATQARVDRLDVSADGASLQIREASVHWQQQAATIRGQISRKAAGVSVDLELDSPGIKADALLQRGAPAGPPAAEDRRASRQSLRTEFFSSLRALAINGRVRLHSNFVDLARYRLAPVTAILTFDPEQVEIVLQDTKLCGLSLPMTVRFAPESLSASAQVLAHKQRLEAVAPCLFGERMILTGEFDARASLAMQGAWDARLSNLEGSVHFESRKGIVRRFALIANILAMTDVIGSLGGGLADLNAEGFAYRTLDIDGHLAQGSLVVEDFTFDSSAFGLAAEGSVGLAQGDTDLTVLVAPFSRLTNLIRKIPIIGYLEGGTLTSVPVAVHGDIRDPTVVPLDPRAIGSDLTALFTRALKIPEKILAPLGASSASPASSSGH